ncbi:MAG: RNA polymerase sigma factor [Planctomycetaceae bacterium]|nr:RNA polymerase sigma factor [Planctomycetaceae bacterium]
MTNSETELVQRCLSGDAAAQAEFVSLFERRVFALCLRMLNHRQDAEDVAQETLLRALRYLPGWDTSRRLAPWVLKIAANRCRTSLSRRNSIPIPCEETPDIEVAPVHVTDVADEVQRGLSGLRENYRECFILFYQQELSVAEVSEVMQIPEGTVKTWLFRARKEMAHYLRERGLAPDES